MISILFDDENLEIKAKGHANYSIKGYDIVCAGVSSLIENYKLYEKNKEVYDFLKFSLRNLEESYPNNVEITG